MSQSTGVPAIDAAVIWSVAAVAIAGAGALVWRMARAARRVLDRMDELADDWHGVPERPGVPARPGVMLRLRQIEERLGRLRQIEERLVRVEHELQPNSGHSLRDAVDRVDRRTLALAPDTDPE